MKLSLEFFICLAAYVALFATANALPGETVVCHRAAIEGMEARIDRLHSMVGPDVTDPHQIRIHITKEGSRVFIQSNYRAQELGTNTHVMYPTKVLWADSSTPDLRKIIGNIIIAAEEGVAPVLLADLEEQIRDATKYVEVTVDPAILGNDGRLPFDLTGVKSIRRANDNQSLESGEIEQIHLSEPPPALMERIDGCCFNGRPPGQRTAIERRLADRPVSREKSVLLAMLTDTGTRNFINDSNVLSILAKNAGPPRGTWPERLDAALSASRGKTLIILAHVSKGKVLIQDAQRSTLFSIGLDDLQSRADRAGVNLILFGYETAKSSESATGVVEAFGTVFAAERIEAALKQSQNARDFFGRRCDSRIRLQTQSAP